ncbi:helix-turn-helix transcriptional regulator [Ktedonosporobacter rubrisoli]|nr:helix-turn-helix transcriptional regulator [Ktedonosporobacter rubrisoli]
MNEQEQRAELARFLRTRRERISPDQAGFPAGKRRRTPGLRREELALAAGVGTTWYTWLEQGRAISVSASVLESLARVLHLNEDERAYLFLLARGQSPTIPAPATHRADPALQLIVENMGIYPSYVICPHWDLIAWNQAACHIYADFRKISARERNFLWFLFTHPQPRTQLVNWEEDAQRTLALFRTSTQRYIGEAWLRELIRDLGEASPEFREWWPLYEVQGMQMRPMHLIHPLVGSLHLQATAFQLPDHRDLRMIVHTPVPNTDTAAKLTALLEETS